MKQTIAKLPAPFWTVFYIFVFLISVSVLAYAGTYILGDPGQLTVTVNQKSGTTDPNPSYTSVFEVVFSEPIDESTFTDPDIALGGTAPGQAVQSITESGTFNKTTYDLRIQATAAGTINPSIAQELVSAQSNPTNTNNISTSTDNSVTYDGTYEAEEFVTTWYAAPSFLIPTTEGGYNYDVDWDNDGIYDQVGITGDVSHNYGASGLQTIRIKGSFPRISFNRPPYGQGRQITHVNQWGSNQWSSMNGAFNWATPWITALDAPNLSNVTDMSGMFERATTVTSDINHWDTSNVTNMSKMFMFANYGGHLASWDTSSVTDMSEMFSESPMDLPINSWDVGNVTNMNKMFSGYNTAFNQPLNNWDTSSVTDMSEMFSWTRYFNQSLNDWDTSYVLNMNRMFYSSAYQEPLNNWNVGNVTNMSEMFTYSSFNQPLNNWNVGNVTNMSLMFYFTPFNQPINAWNVGNVTGMGGMFSEGVFNQPLNSWNVSSVTNMNAMFSGTGSGLSQSNYDATLQGWNLLTLQSNVTFDAASSKYCNSADARQSIIGNFGWTINDGGENCPISKPDVATSPASSISNDQATLNGNVTADGGAAVTAKGFEWGATTSYGTNTGSVGTGSFSTNISYNEQCGQTYHYRAYATNSAGTSYGDNETFTTEVCQAITIPTVTTNDATDNDANIEVYLNGSVDDDGGMAVTARGFEWGASTSFGSNTGSVGTGTGPFTASLALSDLCGEQVYYFRAYATNNVGTAYGQTKVILFEVFCTDISLNVSLLNTKSVKQNDDVKYKLTIKNEGPNNGYSEGIYYVMLPKEFIFQTIETENYGDQVMTVNIDDDPTTPQVYKDNYPGQIMLAFTPNNVDLDNNLALSENGATIFNVGESKSVIIKGKANSDYVNQVTNLNSVFVPFSEFIFAFVVANSSINNQNIFTLPYNNVASHTYTYNPSNPTPPTPNQPPTVSLTAPANNYHFAHDTTSVDIAADANDSDGSISKVRFYLDGKYLSEDTSAPYTAQTTNLKSGSYSVKAVAYDNTGTSTTSSPRVFTILAAGEPTPNPNPPPYTEPEPQTPPPPTKEQQQAFKEKALSLLTPNSPTQVDSLTEQSPKLPEATKYIPWSILALLLAIASLLTYTTKLENKRRIAFDKLNKRFKASLEARAIYLQLTSHYIKTPITKMQATLELLASGVAGSTSSAGSSTGSAVGGSSTASSANPPVSSSSSTTNSSSTGSSPSTLAMSTTTQTMTMPADLSQSTQAIVGQLTDHANELLDAGQSMSGVQQAKINILGSKKPLSVLTSPWFWLPASLVGILTILANFLLVWANVYEPNVINYTAQALLYLVGVIALAITYYFYSQAKLRQQITKDQNHIELETTNRQQAFIAQAHTNLQADLGQLSVLAKDIAAYPKTASFAAGLDELTDIVSQLGKVNDLTKYVPGLTWQTDLTKQLASALSDLSPLADKANVSTKLNQTTNKTSPSHNVNLPQEALRHLLTAPLKNAIQQSAAGQQVVIVVTDSKAKLPSDSYSQPATAKPTSQTLSSRLFSTNRLLAKAQPTIKLTITDQGKGIPKDQLDNLFKPFTSTTSPTEFLDTGLGLDLYLAKVIAEQYGVSLTVDSQVGEGTRLKLELPK